ncbi:MAG: CDP-diacylglycerol--serine O-phosphatidyltransferase [Desulfobacteraceae bacterium]
MQRENAKKGIYVLPNLFTSMNIFCGFYSIISAVEGRFVHAAVSILIGGVFDLLDGKIARATHTTSRFGVEYDSLSDLISFGLAPAVLMYLWAMQPLGRLGWLAAFMFMICGALRLARFNTATAAGADSSYFQGIPIPAAACMIVSTVLFFSRFKIDPAPFTILFLIMLYGLAFLMVSSIKYNSFKNAELFKSLKFNRLVGLILVFVAIAYEPSIALFSGIVLYVLSGLVSALLFHHSHVADVEEEELHSLG